MITMALFDERDDDLDDGNYGDDDGDLYKGNKILGE